MTTLTNKNESVFSPKENYNARKANTVFLKLLSKQKALPNPFGKMREETYFPNDKIKSYLS